MKKKLLVLLLGFAMIIPTGCGSDTDSTIVVESVSEITGLGTVGVTNKYAGIVVTEAEEKINKDSSLEVEEIKVKVGDEVEAGDVLFTYNQDEAELNLEKLQLELEEMENTVSSKEEEKAALEKEAKGLSGSAKLEYEIQIQTLDADIRETSYQIKDKEKEIESAKALLTSNSVTSPISGRIKSINNGESDSSDDGYDMDYDDGSGMTDTTTDAFITIVREDSYQIKGNVNELNAGALQEGMKVTVRSRVDDTTWSGTISRIDWETTDQASSNVYEEGDEMTSSSRYPFYVRLDSEDGLKLGQHVYVDTATDTGDSEEEGFALSSAYIVDPDEAPYVWMEGSNGKLKKQEIELGEYDEEMETYEVLGGLELTDYIAFPSEDCKKGLKCIHSEDAELEDDEDVGEDYSDDGEEYTDDESYSDDGEYIDDGEDMSIDEM